MSDRDGLQEDTAGGFCRLPPPHTEGAPPSQQGKLPGGAHRAGGPRLTQPRPVSFREEVKAPKGFRTSPIPPFE